MISKFKRKRRISTMDNLDWRDDDDNHELPKSDKVNN